MSIIIHHLDNSRSQRILWLMEELGQSYEVKQYRRDKRTMRAPKALRDIHPLGKSPVVTDGSQIVAESAAIIEYLLDKFPNELRPKAGDATFLDYRYWMHYAESSLMTVMVLGLIISKLDSNQVPLPFRPIGWMVSKGLHKQFLEGEYRSHLRYVESRVGEYILGDQFSAADIQLHMPLAAYSVSYGLDEYPKLHDYTKRLESRPAFARAVARGGEFDLNYRD